MIDRVLAGFGWAWLAVTVELWAFRLACLGALVVLALGMFFGGPRTLKRGGTRGREVGVSILERKLDGKPR